MAEFLLELFSEEIPSRLQAPAAEDLLRLLKASLAHLSFGASFSFSTPRRIGCVIQALPERSADKATEIRGPRVGAPEAALAGFLRSSGLQSVDQCEIRHTDKGSFYIAQRVESGRPIIDELASRVPECMDRLVWPKSMRWATHDVRWVRPLHSMLALLSTEAGGIVVPIRWRLDRNGDGGEVIAAGNVTYGHRMLAPAAITVDRFDDYRAKLAAAFVLLDIHGDGPMARRQKIAGAIDACAASENLTIRQDVELLDEVTGLVEWPVVRLGRIEPRFMELPAELLTTSMRTHQKYFACEAADGVLAPYFVVVGNNETRDGGKQMVAGNERVLRARLSDAEFFWQQDRSVTLESRVPKLAERVFHAKLGSVLDKIGRMGQLADRIEPGHAAAQRAVLLSKADLSSALVGEFPELQGVMGRYLALHDNESSEVADAIQQHYAPTGPNSPVPTAWTSVIVALSDKIDTLAGFFAIDETPTGSKDPFALRRAALGVIRIILEVDRPLPLRRVFEWALDNYSIEKKPDCRDGILRFMVDRLRVVLRDRGIRHDVVDAVFATGGEDDLVCLTKKAEALQDFLSGEDGRNLLIAYRRAIRILFIEEKRDAVLYREPPSKSAFEIDQEHTLVAALANFNIQGGPHWRGGDYSKVITLLADLRGPVDAFFDKVTVNSEKPGQRINRLKILGSVKQAMDQIADFSKIEG